LLVRLMGDPYVNPTIAGLMAAGMRQI